jgi:hypothetical protein
MGAGSSSTLDARYIRIWNNLNAIQAIDSRAKMLDKLIHTPEIAEVAKTAGVYAPLVIWLNNYNNGKIYKWPETTSSVTSDAITGQTPKQIASKKLQPIDVLNDSYKLLGLDSNKPISLDELKNVYKRIAVKVHPDKGGSPEQFDAVTKAYLYIQDVLKILIPMDVKTDNVKPVTMDDAIRVRNKLFDDMPELRDETPQQIAINPKKMDMNVFNKMFEEFKISDPVTDAGYGEWLKSSENTRALTHNALNGEFNKDVFNNAFVQDARRVGTSDKSALSAYNPPSDIILSYGFGTELVHTGPVKFTQSAGSVIGVNGLGYTDLKDAYGDCATFTQDVADIEVKERNFKDYKQAYEKAPDALSEKELEALKAYEAAKKYESEQKALRLAARDVDIKRQYTTMKSRLLINQ